MFAHRKAWFEETEIPSAMHPVTNGTAVPYILRTNVQLSARLVNDPHVDDYDKQQSHAELCCCSLRWVISPILLCAFRRVQRTADRQQDESIER